MNHNQLAKSRMAALAVAAAVLAGCLHPPPPPSPAPRQVGVRTSASTRDLRYLELAFDQIRSYERSAVRLDDQRLGAGALSAAALAGGATGWSAGRTAARWVEAGLDDCTGHWETVACERMLLSFQRVILQYPGVLPAALRERLRTEAASFAPPPGAEAVREPWNFKETENQRAVRMARCLGALRVDPGAPGSARAAAGAAWGAAAAAFLRAHDREGWYEAESPGYISISMNALLHMADHAPQPAVRALARRELDLLFADWAQKQVDGFPAGPKSRSYSHWALGAVNTPWTAWAWRLAGLGDPDTVQVMDWPEIATSGYAVPEPVVRLLAARREQPPYEIAARRTIALPGRHRLDTAVYSFATPDYILGTAQSVGGLSLGLSGGEEIMATLYAAGAELAPLYLWSRTRNLRTERWKSWAGQDLVMGHRNVVLARLNAAPASAPPAEENGDPPVGYAYLSPPWRRPELVGDAVVSRCGDTYVALVTVGGWDVAPAPVRFPGYFGGDAAFRGAWAAVPRAQPASVALEVGRRSEAGDFARWKRRAAAFRLTTTGDGEMRFTASDGTLLTFVPGRSATVDGRPLDVAYSLLAGPFLASSGAGQWTFSFGGEEVRFAALD